jgi:Ser/Thr protein kinase RdoA (MazF antagonist)
MHSRGFTQCPEYLGIEGSHEVLSYVEGDTFNYPLEGHVATQTALMSAGRLLRRLHDATETFLHLHNPENLRWMLPGREPQEVICHGDPAPYNVALKGDEVVGVFDFDAAHPAPRVWDLAYAAYTWAPFKTTPADARGSLAEQIHRAGLFCRSYGASPRHRADLVETMILRLQALVVFMRNEAEAGNGKFQDDISHGHDLGYLADIAYLRTHEQAITAGLAERQRPRDAPQGDSMRRCHDPRPIHPAS